MIRLFFLFLALLATPAIANDDLKLRDSVYYTMDDGIMSPEEMEMEATDMYRLCNMNPYQKTYINCECLAGAFLIQREKLGPLATQYEIFEGINRNETANCSNTEEVAGSTYQMCMDHSRVYRELEPDNQEYCECVGNGVAKEFARQPILSSGYISHLNGKYLASCVDPRNRPQKRPPAASANLN